MLISILLLTLALLLVAVGVAGTIMPGLPGTVLVLAGLVLAAWIDSLYTPCGFDRRARGLFGGPCFLGRASMRAESQDLCFRERQSRRRVRYMVMASARKSPRVPTSRA